MIERIENTENSPQNLTLDGKTLTISGGNSISFKNWDNNPADDPDGEYSSLKGAPKVYTQDEVNAIKSEILSQVIENYSPAKVVTFSSSRNVSINDVGNTPACTSSKLWGGNRAEFAQFTNTTMEEGWYGFSKYFPETYTTENIEELVGQWHDIPDDNETAARSPSNAISTGNGRFKWITRWDSRSIQTNNITEGYFEKDLGAIPKGKWIDWVVHIKFSHTNTGIVWVWMDGVKVINRQNLPKSFNDIKYPYFKIIRMPYYKS